MNREQLKAVFLMGLACFFSSELILKAAAGASVLGVFPFLLVPWTLYLLSHYILNGRFVDEETSEYEGLRKSENTQNIYLTLIGLFTGASAFAVGVYGVRNTSYPMMLLSQFFFIYGYMLGHYGVSGKLL